MQKTDTVAEAYSYLLDLQRQIVIVIEFWYQVIEQFF